MVPVLKPETVARMHEMLNVHGRHELSAEDKLWVETILDLALQVDAQNLELEKINAALFPVVNADTGDDGSRTGAEVDDLGRE